VTPAGVEAAPHITRPVLITRWLIRGSFDHSKHPSLTCTKCPDAADSHDTAAIILPSKTTCVECHSPQGGVANNCATCHSYHAPGGGKISTAVAGK